MEKCFANAKGGCRVMRDGKFQCEGCKFYKSDAQFKGDALMAFRRIASLPQEEQVHISEKYYYENMPWFKYSKED